MLQQCIISMALLILLGGCVANRDVNRKQMSDLKQSYSQFDLKIAWDVTISSSETRIDGLVENIRTTQMEEMELWVNLRDNNDKSVFRKAYYFPSVLKKNEVVPFSFMLPVRASSGSKLVFTYRYVPLDGGDTERWMQSFETSIPVQLKE